MPTLTPEYVFRRYETDGVPDSGPHKVNKDEVVELLNKRNDVGGYNLDWGIKINGVQTFAPRNGVDDDSAVLNAILAQERSVVVTPGVVNVKSAGLVTEFPNARIKAIAGMQSVTIQRSLDLPAGQNTLRLGSPTVVTKGARGAVLEDLWFVHPGRLETSNGSITSLANRLVNDESHVVVYGGQGGYYRIGGYGAVHVMTFYGGSGNVVDHPFLFGGVWHPTNAALQEAVSHIRARSHSLWGHGTNLHIRTPEIYGQNRTTSTSRTIGALSYAQASGFRIGPKHGLLIESCEDWSIEGGFMAGNGHSNVALIPASANDLIFNGKIRGTYIDESHEFGIYALNNAGDAQCVSQLDLQNVTFNGQLVGLSAMHLRGDGSGGYSVRRLKMTDCKGTAYASGAFRLSGVDGGEVRGLRAMGYNLANNDATNGTVGAAFTSGLFLDGSTRNLQVDNCRYGGGTNRDTDANNCQYGFVDATSGQGNTYSRQRAINLGKAGGGAVVGGTLDNAA